MKISARKRAYLLLTALFLGLAGLWWLETYWGDGFDPDRLRAYINPFGNAAPLVYIAFLVLAIVIPPLPDLALVVAGGLSFGVFYGTVYTLLAGLIGAGINFWIARWLGRKFLLRWLGPGNLTRVDALAVHNGWLVLCLTRLVPGFNFDLISYAAGLTAMSFFSFTTATLVGMIPPVLAVTTASDKSAHTPQIALVALAVGLLGWLTLPTLIYWISKSQAKKEP